MKKRKLLTAILVVLAALSVFAACDDNTEGGGAGDVTAIAITSKPTAPIYFSYNSVGQLDYTLTPATATVNVVWSSSEPSVATVNKNGRYTQKGIGKTTITATVENTEISDSFDLQIIEQPSFKVSVDGVDVNAGFRLDGSNVDQSMLRIEESRLVLDSGDVSILNPAVSIDLATPLEANTLYRLQFKMQFTGAQHNSGSAALKILSGNRSGVDDWYHVFFTDTVFTTAENTVRGVFTTPSSKLNAVELMAFEKPSSSDPEFSLAAKLAVYDVELIKVPASDVTVSLERKEQLGSVTMNAVDQALTITRKIQYFGIDLPGGQRTDWTTSDPSVIALAPNNQSGYDGNFVLKAPGRATITVTPYGIAGASSDSIEITVTDGTSEPVPGPFAIEYNGETLQLGESDVILGVAGGDRNTYIDADENGIEVDTRGAETFKWPSVKINLPAGKYLERESLYYVEYDLNLAACSIADGNIQFKIGTPSTQDGWAHYAVYNNQSKGTQKVKCIFSSVFNGDGEGTTNLDAVELFVVGNDADLTDLQCSISNIKIAKIAKEDLTLTITNASEATTAGDFTFRRSGVQYKGADVPVCGMMTQWSAESTAVVNFTKPIDGVATLAEGTTSIYLGIKGIDGALDTKEVTVAPTQA